MILDPAIELDRAGSRDLNGCSAALGGTTILSKVLSNEQSGP
jgi:hypothetical protein